MELVILRSMFEDEIQSYVPKGGAGYTGTLPHAEPSRGNTSSSLCISKLNMAFFEISLLWYYCVLF